MADSTTLPTVPNAHQWDQDVVYSTICSPVRRQLLSLLAKGKPMTAADLSSHVKGGFSRLRSQIDVLRAAGFVGTPGRDRTDGRRQLYILLPTVPLKTTSTGKIIDFGFCVLKLNHQ